MNDDVKKAYLDKTAAQIAIWSAQIDVLKAQFAKGTASARLDIHNHLEKWKEKESQLKVKVEELRSAGAENYEAVKLGVQNVYGEISSLIDKLEGKKGKV